MTLSEISELFKRANEQKERGKDGSAIALYNELIQEIGIPNKSLHLSAVRAGAMVNLGLTYEHSRQQARAIEVYNALLKDYAKEADPDSRSFDMEISARAVAARTRLLWTQRNPE